MESTPRRPTAEEASAALLEAEATRAALADHIATPSWFFVSMGVAIAAQIATVAVGLGDKPALDAGELGSPWLVAAGLAVFAAVAGVQVARFRRLNGVWLGGFASRVVLGTATAASVSYPVALGAAIWAAYGERWWLVALWSLVGGAAYALSGLRWMHTYRGDPAAHARGESLAWLALVRAAAQRLMAKLDEHVVAPCSPDAHDDADRGFRGGVRHAARDAGRERLRAVQTPRRPRGGRLPQAPQGRPPRAPDDVDLPDAGGTQGAAHARDRAARVDRRRRLSAHCRGETLVHALSGPTTTGHVLPAAGRRRRAGRLGARWRADDAELDRPSEELAAEDDRRQRVRLERD